MKKSIVINPNNAAGCGRKTSIVFLAVACLFLTGMAFGGTQSSAILYQIDLRKPASNLVYVTMSIPMAAAGTEFQIPTWSNLYQIRDFVRDIQNVQGQCNGKPSPLGRVDVNTWKSLRRCSDLEVHYAAYANQDNVFSAVLDARHAFLNFGLLLFYLPHHRQRPARVKFLAPPGWKIYTMLRSGPERDEYQARDYDRLVDCPAEAGHFQEYSYVQKEATYRIIVDGNPGLYAPQKLVAVIKKITDTETGLMHDVPFKRYTFMLFFPEHGGGGMEHRNGTAISVPAADMRAGLGSLEAIVAHEFFHLWNVKRIRPQGLEPIDYIHGNDTSDLWFSEGITNTYAELVLLRTGLINTKQFYKHLSAEINQLQSRPARHFQSVEESGREAWLEKYADYFRPQRSISYYNKGELLGYLLDLGIRHATGNRRSLDDLLRTLNEDFAMRSRFFNDSDLERIIGQLAPGFSCRKFFRDDVDGTRELDYSKFLGYAGLELKARIETVPDLGFQALKSFIGPVRVEAVHPDSNAARAGLQMGDVLLKMNGVELPVTPERELVYFAPGQRVTFAVQRHGQILKISFRLGAQKRKVYKVEESANPTSAQLLVRNGWLRGETNGSPRAGE